MDMDQANEPFLYLSHVNVARGENVVLYDINLSVNAGEHIAILGPNGCGKSTLIKTITCECYPVVEDATKVKIFGRDRWDLTELKKRLGVVSPELPGKPTLTTTGRDAVITGFFSSSTLWPNLTVTDEMRDRADEVLKLIDAESLRDKLVGHMSAGQQRRIMIGRALVASSQMLLLDEPSNALDIAAQRDLRDLRDRDRVIAPCREQRGGRVEHPGERLGLLVGHAQSSIARRRTCAGRSRGSGKPPFQECDRACPGTPPQSPP